MISFHRRVQIYFVFILSALLLGGASVRAQEIWIDGSAVKYQFQPYLEANPEIAKKIIPILDRLTGIEIVPGHAVTRLHPRFNNSFTVPVANEKEISNWSIYQVDVPENSEFIVSGEDGVIRVEQSINLDQWQVQAKLPMMADNLHLNRLEVDFNRKEVFLEAGVMKNWVKVVAHATLKGNKLSKIDIDLWESLRKNLGFGKNDGSTQDLYSKTNRVPSFKKVFMVVLENADAAQALEQPFLKELASKGAYLNQFLAVAHPSQPNYLAMIGGSTFSVLHDGNVDLNERTFVDLLEEKGRTWKVYAEGYPGNCFLGSKKGRYVRKHVPFLSFKNIQSNPQRCSRIVEDAELAVDVFADRLEDFSFYVPDLVHDGHDLGIQTADAWLSTNFKALLKNPHFMKDLLFVVTFDEGSWFGSNRVYTVLYGDGVIPGKVSNEPYDFYSLLRTFEEGFGLENLGKNDARAQVISEVWR